MRVAMWWLIGMATAAAALAATGGCGPARTVLRQAEPNPFGPRSRFVVEPIDYARLDIDGLTERQYLARKDAGGQASFQRDKRVMDRAFFEHLRRRFPGMPIVDGGAGSETAFIVRPVLVHWEPGVWYGVHAEALMTVLILTPDERTLDVVRLRAAAIAGAATPSSGDRMRECGEELGDELALYLRDRVPTLAD